jgi:hypothetical protein
MPIENLDVLKHATSEVVHLQDDDLRPLCWDNHKAGGYNTTTVEAFVNCPECLDLMGTQSAG